MSRGQEGAVVGTSKAQNSTYFNNAQNSYNNAQSDVGDFQKQLSDYKGQVANFSAKNPYVQGGEFQTATNQQTANTADAAARAAGQRLQGQALRTGNNSAGAIAATEEMERQGTRDLSADQARATQQRIQGEAGYNKEALGANQGVLEATAQPVQMEANLSGQQGNLAGGALSTEQKAGETPSWFDEFGNAFAQSYGNTSAAGTRGRTKLGRWAHLNS